MSLTTKQAMDLLNTQITTQVGSIPILFQGEDNILPDISSSFIFIDIIVWNNRIAAFGGGLGRNAFESRGNYDAYCFVPKGYGVGYALDYAQQVRNAFRGFRNDDLIIEQLMVTPGGDGSSIKPDGIPSEVSLYYFALVEIVFSFRETG